MTDTLPQPPALDAIYRDSAAIGFAMASEAKTGALLKALAASKPRARLLELGTGTGVATAWLLAGMDSDSVLDSVENDPGALAVAKRHLGNDPRVTFHEKDAAGFLSGANTEYDFIFADTWAGKFTHREHALSLLRPGGIYLVDDLLPQPNWPEGHSEKIPPLIAELESKPGFAVVRMDWASGLMLVVKTTTDGSELSYSRVRYRHGAR